MPKTALSWFCLCALVLLLPGTVQAASTLNRDLDPVVLTGSSLTALLGLAPGSVVAFRYQGGWGQIPVQIDERDEVTYDQVYGGGFPAASILVATYTDPGSYVGADTDPLFDADDELVFMASDAGDLAPAGSSYPIGTVPVGGVVLEIDDPLDGGLGYVYLFESSGSLSPGAGADYVSYTFDLLAGSYPADYNLANGPNPEDSVVATARYVSHFSDRWIHDEISITAGGATGVDILDRHRNIFAPGVCSRSEDTFSAGEGAFFANIDGPVRAIRSYMGANSGPLTQRVHVFYAGREDITTFLRVHAISGIMDMFDYSSNAIGMTYSSSTSPGGVSVDGTPDVVSSAVPSWEMVTGAQGSLIVAASQEADFSPLSPVHYYEDDASPSYIQCTGDAFEFAQSGAWINHAIPNTDPLLGTFNHLVTTRVLYFEGPGKTAADALQRSLQAGTSPTVTVTSFAVTPVPVLSPGVWVGLALALAGAGAPSVRGRA